MRYFVLLLVLSVSRLLANEQPAVRHWKIAGIERSALIYAPSKPGSAALPVLFAFHGHGGTMNHAAQAFGFHNVWPEAIVVYPQGLNTPGQLTDLEGKKPGWQRTAGDQADRDLLFFDAMLESLQSEFRIDAKRIYASGHSNGGGFTYLLWSTRGDRLAAVGPSAAVARPEVIEKLTPKPVLHIAGETDPLVKFAWQKRLMDGLREQQKCGPGEGMANGCTRYPSSLGTPVLTYIHPGGHEWPPQSASLIVDFFKSIP